MMDFKRTAAALMTTAVLAEWPATLPWRRMARTSTSSAARRTTRSSPSSRRAWTTRPGRSRAYGGTVNFLQLQTYDQIGPDAANLVRTAINQGADGIAVPNWVARGRGSGDRRPRSTQAFL